MRLITHRGELYLQFVGSMRTFDETGKPERKLEGRQWLGRLERTPQVRSPYLSFLDGAVRRPSHDQAHRSLPSVSAHTPLEVSAMEHFAALRQQLMAPPDTPVAEPSATLCALRWV